MDVPPDALLEEEIEVPIRALEHYSYCPRQCAMVHIEQTFDDNEFTIRGRITHERVDTGDKTPVRGVRVLRAIPLWCERLGLRGMAAAVVLGAVGPSRGVSTGGRRHGAHADLQLCAQALCLEEMLGVPVTHGAIYYAALRRRHEVAFDTALRERTEAMVTAIRTMLREQRLPDAPNDERCRRCAQINACLPAVVGEPARIRGWQSVLFHPLPLSSADSDEDDDAAEEPWHDDDFDA
jgi:CRISPR-associated exonuclease Cas4